MKKLFILLYLILNFIFNASANAEAFYIKNYDVRLKVNENKNINITEVLDVYFTEKRHGIVRTIPYSNLITRQDGTKENMTSKISNVTVNNNFAKTYSSYNGNKTLDIKIGSADKYVSGSESYIIQYDYKIPKPKTLKNKDELYFNLIGNDWETNIDKVNFEITMPKEFDKNLLGFSVGLKGTSGHTSNEISYVVDGNTIKGKMLRSLKDREGLTVRLELPEDYFNYAKPKFFNFGSFLVIILTCLSVLAWYLIGKDEKIIPVVNFYPPNNLNSATIGSLHREKADEKDIVSLIIYLASKGYIKIENKLENHDSGVLETIENYTAGYNQTAAKSYTLCKLKEYDGKSSIELKLMQALFKQNTVRLSELMKSEEFYKECSEIVKLLNKNCKKLYIADSVDIKAYIIPVISVISSVVFLLYSVFGDFSFLFNVDTFVLVLMPVIAIFVFVKLFKTNPVFAILWCMGFGGIPLIALNDITGGFEFNSSIIFSVIALIINIICLYNMPKKSKNALRLLGEIAGFKHFLEVAEKHRIELLVKENPSYCFDILPYAYVLGVSDKFIKNFEGLIKSEFWSGALTINSFNGFTSYCYKTTKPSVENGGISSGSSHGGGGGGFSGGGSGGGGGHSW